MYVFHITKELENCHLTIEELHAHKEKWLFQTVGTNAYLHVIINIYFIQTQLSNKHKNEFKGHFATSPSKQKVVRLKIVS